MYKVGIVGPESTGKSTLAQCLARRHKGVYIPEYARTYVESLPCASAYTMADVEHIARHQVAQLQELETRQREDKQVYFFDTELIITKIWFLEKYDVCPEFVERALRQYPMDMYLLCYPDLPWVYDPVRENPDKRRYLYDLYEHEIQMLDIPYYIVRHELNGENVAFFPAEEKSI